MPRRDLAPALHLLLAFSVAIALYRGFQLPSLWTANYYLLDLQHGFHRRFLLGTLLDALGDARFHYHVVAAIQVAVTALLAAVIVARAANAPAHIELLAAAFFAGDFGAYFFYSVGYPDHLLFLLLFAALAARSAAVPAIVAAASVLVHEAAALITIPLLLFVQLVRGERRAAAISLGAALMAFAYISMHQVVSEPLLEAYRAELYRKTDYNARVDYLEIFSQAFTGARWMNHYKLREWRELGGAFAVCGVACIGLRPALRREGQRWLAPIAAGAILAPLALGFFGWDVYRWIFLSGCSAVFLVVWFDPGEKAALGLAIALAVFSLGAELHFFFNDAPRAVLPSAIEDFVRDELPRLPQTIPIR